MTLYVKVANLCLYKSFQFEVKKRAGEKMDVKEGAYDERKHSMRMGRKQDVLNLEYAKIGLINSSCIT